MKKHLVLLITVVLVVTMATDSTSAQAKVKPGGLETHQEWCEGQNWSDGESWKTGIWEESSQECYLQSKVLLKSGKKYLTNKCWPDYDILKADGYTPKGIPLWKNNGCGAPVPPAPLPPTSGKRVAFSDLHGGKVKIPNPGEFGYDPGTCAGHCSIAYGGLMPSASAALTNLSGKVLDKTYVMIKGNDGDLTEGSFKLCFRLKNAKNPTFFRFGGGGWVYFGGFWQGSSFCMWGNTSGNYVLVDQAK